MATYNAYGYRPQFDPSQFTEEEGQRLRELELQFEAEHDGLIKEQIMRLEFAKWLADNHVISEYPDLT